MIINGFGMCYMLNVCVCGQWSLMPLVCVIGEMFVCVASDH